MFDIIPRKYHQSLKQGFHKHHLQYTPKNNRHLCFWYHYYISIYTLSQSIYPLFLSLFYVIAAFLHIKQNTYSQYENGKRQLPIEILISLARFYNVSTDFILGLTDNEDPYN